MNKLFLCLLALLLMGCSERMVRIEYQPTKTNIADLVCEKGERYVTDEGNITHIFNSSGAFIVDTKNEEVECKNDTMTGGFSYCVRATQTINDCSEYADVPAYISNTKDMHADEFSFKYENDPEFKKNIVSYTFYSE